MNYVLCSCVEHHQILKIPFANEIEIMYIDLVKLIIYDKKDCQENVCMVSYIKEI